MTNEALPKQLDGVEDLDEPRRQYDLTICASGYEPRARHAYLYYRAKGIDLGKLAVLGFENHRGATARLANDRVFRAGGAEPVIVPHGDSTAVWKFLREQLLDVPDNCRILIDYSSMSRTWISAIAAWLTEANAFERVAIDWTYSPGSYPVPFHEDTRILGVRKAPGTYGGMGQFPKSLLVCSVGADSLATRALLRHLEVHELVILHALDGQNGPLDGQVRASHAGLIERANHTQAVPLRQVAYTFDFLREVAQPAIGSRNVVFAALGPKPHFLAMVLAGLAIPRVHVLHVSREWKSPAEISSNQVPTLTRVSLSRQQLPSLLGPAAHL